MIAVIVVACCFVLQWWACGLGPDLGPEGNPLPPLSAIDSINGTLADPRPTDPQGKFAVPRDLWSDLYQALQPARLDGSPKKWLVLGRLELNFKDGKRTQVFLFRPHPGPGALALGEDWDHRDYYRGGDSDRLQAVLESAQSLAKPASPAVDPV